MEPREINTAHDALEDALLCGDAYMKLIKKAKWLFENPEHHQELINQENEIRNKDLS